MPLRKVPVAWTTGIGGAGVSIFYSLEATDITASLGTFFTAVKAYHPAVVTWNIPASGDIIDIPTGRITGAWSGGTAATIAATGSGAYVAGTGAYVRWNTAQIRDGRRMKGRTFLCPLITVEFDNTGTLANTDVAAMQTAASNLAATGTLIIYGRPRGPGATDGQSAVVTGAVVADRVTSLRSRRT